MCRDVDSTASYRQHRAMHPITDYFRDDVLVKRPYIKLEWCLMALENPVRREIQQEDGRIRLWVFVPEL